MQLMTELDLAHKRVLIREDFNVPMDDSGHITDDARIQAALPTIKYALQANAAVILLSHLGRPKPGEDNIGLSLAPVAKRLSQLLDTHVRFEENWLSGFEIAPGEVVLCENVRFNKGEKENDPGLAQMIAGLGDVFIMDAFATAHRAEASTAGVSQFIKEKAAGFLLGMELAALEKAMARPKSPLLAVVGGAKVSTKLTVLNQLLKKVDHLIVGGGIANTLLAAKGFNVGQSLYEPEFMAEAKILLSTGKIPLPVDVVVAKEFSDKAQASIVDVNSIADDDMVLDIGPETQAMFAELIAKAGTIIWNGPVGVFEIEQFSGGTLALSQAIAESNAFSIAGGGDTLAAIAKYNIADKLSYISTGGGAFLEFIEGKALPAVAALD